MTDADILEKVKAGLSVGGTYNDAQLQIKTVAVKEYMRNAGVSQARIETDLGIACLTVGVMDLWNITSGDVRFSPAFSLYLLPQLQIASLKDAEEEEEET